MKVTITKPGVTDGSSILEVGTAIECPETVAESLINGGYATAEKSEEAVEGAAKAAEKSEEAADDTPKTRKTTAKKTK